MQNTNSAIKWPATSVAPAPIVIRQKAARAYIGNVSQTLLKQLERGGEIEKIKLGPRAVAYTVSSLDAFLARRLAASREASASAHIAAPEVEAGIVASNR